ncbi:hypothetical protein [Cetobacterium ceti]
MKIYNLAFKYRIYPNETQAKELVPLKLELPFLKEVDSIALQQSLKNLETAYKNFFQKRTNFPKFKSKRSTRKSYNTVSTSNNIRVEGNFLKLPKLGLVKIKLHRAISQNYAIKSATISQEPKGAYYASIQINVFR